MTEYNQICAFGLVYFEIGNISASEQPSTLKSNMGKTYVETEIIGRNTKDTVLRVSGVITGLSRTSAQTLSQAIETDRAALIALDDGNKHTWADGRHSGNFVIVIGSLRWEDNADRSPGEPHRFSVEVKSW